MTDNGTLNLLGLARRGGNLAMGEEPVAEACRLGKAGAVLLAADAGDTTARRAAKAAESGGIPLIALPWSKAEIGFHLGRSVCAVLAVTDRGLTAAVIRRLAAQDESLCALAEKLEQKTARRVKTAAQREKKHSARTDGPSAQR